MHLCIHISGATAVSSPVELVRGMQMPIRREEVVIPSGKWKRNRKTQPWFIRKLREEG